MDDEAKEDMKKWVMWFKEFTYKPNFSYILETGLGTPFGLPKVTLMLKVPNARTERHEEITISKVVVLDHFYSEQYALEYVHMQLQELELHELDEWFRHKGELVFDPHA